MSQFGTFASLLSAAGITPTTTDEPAPRRDARERAPSRQSTGITPVMTLDDRRLVVPAYGFDDERKAAAYLEAVGTTLDDGRRVRTVIRSGGRVYVERDVLMSEHEMDLYPLGDRRGTLDRRYHQPWLTLRRAETPKPDGAYHVLLLPEGRRETSWFGDRKRAAPWVKRARTGPWEMAVAWERGDGESLRPVCEWDGLRVYAARSVRGVLIARRFSISAAGVPEHAVTQTWLVTLDVFDHKAGTDDVVRPHFEVHTFMDDADPDPTKHRGRLHESAWPCFDRAAQIFRAQCGIGLPAATERHLRFFREQNEKSCGHEGDAFRARLKELDWLAGTDLVQEPWQMALAVWAYSGQFGREEHFPTSGEQTEGMIEQYAAARPARAALVRRWMGDYVSQTTDMWNYRGD
ncbi:hypothetical protein A2304_05230 [Candidatus Uhrbacteria bacterium RIFOXYB2_FULL_57_15]|uniref:Uncharacterized protein n=1 Tax=Candidatus Uhrbacteria bacterium RIFOXYB2_FULL_57_15 TaxID=1802422 RepID=A0A1F7WAS9_9BACT|nr:MAG: hypothetical protein A2304_05230 [Candidatus Uhrbacteria bacterium RIFOXYB2_FULL_57_15]